MGQREEPLPAAAGLRPRRSLGQHFLVDRELRDRVVAAAGIRPDDEVLEIGAGPGTLTGQLTRLARRVVAVELDRRLLPRLRAAAPGAEVVNEDVLRVDHRALFPGGGEIVVGNVPYYLTGALVPHLLGREPRPRRLSLVVQREVARRWCGLDGWSLATVGVQVFSEPRIELELPPEAFDPPPRVTSALAILEVHARPAGMAKAAFKEQAAAVGRVLGVAGDEAAARLASAGIEPTRRAETLDLREWERAFRLASRLS